MARFFNFSNTEEFVLELQPTDLLSSEERALSYGPVRKKAVPSGEPTRKEARKRNELRVIGRFERFDGKERKFFLN